MSAFKAVHRAASHINESFRDSRRYRLAAPGAKPLGLAGGIAVCRAIAADAVDIPESQAGPPQVRVQVGSAREQMKVEVIEPAISHDGETACDGGRSHAVAQSAAGHGRLIGRRGGFTLVELWW